VTFEIEVAPSAARQIRSWTLPRVDGSRRPSSSWPRTGFTRGLTLFLVPFLLVAWVIPYLFPGETTRLWAWTIPSTMTSMTLASAYLGGAWLWAGLYFTAPPLVVLA
jgi:hypothetical protein